MEMTPEEFGRSIEHAIYDLKENIGGIADCLKSENFNMNRDVNITEVLNTIGDAFLEVAKSINNVSKSIDKIAEKL